MSEQLIREYVKLALNEDDMGGFDMGDISGPYGMSFGSQQDLYSVFVKPFTDVVSTATAETKKLSQRVQTMMKVSVEAVISTLIPYFSTDYKRIFDEQDDALDKIKAQYKDVYDATWTSFKDNDVALAAFFYKPAAVITTVAAAKAPQATVAALNVLAGGRLDDFLAKVKKKFNLGDERKPLGRDVEGPGMPEGVIREADNKTAKLAKVLTQPKIISVVNSNPKVNRMSQLTQKVVNGTLAKVVKQAQAINRANSLDDFEKLSGKKIPGLEKLSQLSDDEKKQLSAQVLPVLKKAAKNIYAKNLEGAVNSAKKAGIPDDHPYIKAHIKAIQAIKS